MVFKYIEARILCGLAIIFYPFLWILGKIIGFKEEKV